MKIIFLILSYQKTSAGFKSATQKITPAFQTLGGTMKSSLGSLRNASLFKSFETGFGSTFNGVKIKKLINKKVKL